MNYRVQEIKVGITVTVSFLLLVLLLVAVSGIRWHKKTVTYTTRFSYVGGLSVGSPVRLGGLQVGRVARILPPSPTDRRIALELEVAEGTPVKRDSRAYLTSVGLMGEFYVEIRPGSPDAPELPPGSEIPALDATTFSQLSASMGDLVNQVQDLLTGVNRLVDPNSPDGLPALLAQVNTLLAENRQELHSVLAGTQQLLATLDRTTQELSQALSEERPVAHATLQRLDSVLVVTGALLSELQQTSRQMTALLGQSSGAATEIVARLQRSTRNLEALSRTLRDRPWLLVRKSAPKPREIPDR